MWHYAGDFMWVPAGVVQPKGSCEQAYTLVSAKYPLEDYMFVAFF